MKGKKGGKEKRERERKGKREGKKRKVICNFSPFLHPT